MNEKKKVDPDTSSYFFLQMEKILTDKRCLTNLTKLELRNPY